MSRALPSLRLAPSTVKRLGTAVHLLLAWHAANPQDYLWRELRRTPYVVLVSEFMLQQTGVKQVSAMLPKFLKRFPTVTSLATASTADVLRAWQGLGYNRRALNLQRAAQAIAARGRKGFPDTLEGLLELPGVGAYTAAAVLTFTHNANIPVVDVNIERVLSRVWQQMDGFANVLPMPEITALDARILPHGRSAEWHEALMDLGATICTKRKPKCEACPVLEACKSGPRFIKLEHHELENTVPKRETLYFGQPRRIWRGRVLTVVANAGKVTVLRIVKELAAQHEIAAPEFEMFVAELVALLEKDGLIQKRGRSYELAE